MHVISNSRNNIVVLDIFDEKVFRDITYTRAFILFTFDQYSEITFKIKL